MNGFTGRVGFGAYAGAAVSALQWRLLILWVLALLVPTLIVALPVFGLLHGQLGHWMYNSALAQQLSMPVVHDLWDTFTSAKGALASSGIVAVGLTLLIAPWLTGMAVASGRAARPLSFGGLIQGGFVEYGRMFRVALWSLVPYAVAIAVHMAMTHYAENRGDDAVLQSVADSADRMALIVSLVVFAIMQAIVESMRAQYVADLGLRSATRAFGRSLRQIVRRPLTTLLVYLVITAIGLGVAAVIAYVRIRTPALGAWGFILAFVLVQVGVMATAWMHVARIYSLAMVARSMVFRRRRPV
jgi:hypothetical protein